MFSNTGYAIWNHYRFQIITWIKSRITYSFYAISYSDRLCSNIVKRSITYTAYWISDVHFFYSSTTLERFATYRSQINIFLVITNYNLCQTCASFKDSSIFPVDFWWCLISNCFYISRNINFLQTATTIESCRSDWFQSFSKGNRCHSVTVCEGLFSNTGYTIWNYYRFQIITWIKSCISYSFHTISYSDCLCANIVKRSITYATYCISDVHFFYSSTTLERFATNRSQVNIFLIITNYNLCQTCTSFKNTSVLTINFWRGSICNCFYICWDVNFFQTDTIIKRCCAYIRKTLIQYNWFKSFTSRKRFITNIYDRFWCNNFYDIFTICKSTISNLCYL